MGLLIEHPDIFAQIPQRATSADPKRKHPGD
jgi:hypothetical protein